MPRQLTKVEKFFIEKNRNLSAEELAADFDGIGPKTVQQFLDELPPSEEPPEVPEEPPNQTPKERQADLAPLGLKAGDHMARDPEAGYTAMTKEAAEIAEANNPVVESRGKAAVEERNKTRIHRPLGNRKSYKG